MFPTILSIAQQPPITPLFDTVNGVQDLRKLTPEQLPQLAYELRLALLYSVGQTGGHLGAGLGVVELTIALHYLLNTPNDRLIWDVGHQAYPHKMLTGRKNAMLSMRQRGGLAPFLSAAKAHLMRLVWATPAPQLVLYWVWSWRVKTLWRSM